VSLLTNETITQIFFLADVKIFMTDRSQYGPVVTGYEDEDVKYVGPNQCFCVRFQILHNVLCTV